jgi:isovaleryl-CoA dehydrogenase
MNPLFAPTPEHAALRDLACGFARDEVAAQAAEYDRAERFNLALFRRAGELGLLGLLAPPDYGGSGMDATAAVILHEELGSADPGFALACLSHAVLFVNGLAQGGDPALCARILPSACTGERIGAMAMSEAAAGSDLTAMRTRARPEGDGYVLDGVKSWITNGANGTNTPADLVLVYARTSNSALGGLSLFLVEGEMAGFRVGREVRGKLGMRASTCAELVFESCVVPAGNRIGDQGDGLAAMIRTFAIERLALAAIALGIARRAIQVMNTYATVRRVGGRPLRELGQIQRHLAESYADYLAGRCMVYSAASSVDLATTVNGPDCDAAKLFCGTMAKSVADRAIQVLGANGYVEGYEVDRLWRDARLIEIGGGTNEVLQKNITRHLGRIEELT